MILRAVFLIPNFEFKKIILLRKNEIFLAQLSFLIHC